jgi:sulfite exporter TauE/SafE
VEAALGIFLASLAGSPHCAAMCGPFLAFAAASDERPGAGRRRIPLTAYHGGRLVAYLAVGVAAGALGAGVERLGALAGIGRGAAVVAGVLMVAWGLNTLLALRGWRLGSPHGPVFLQRALAGVVRRVGGLPAVTRAGLTGLATALLPCGWLYAFAAAAGGTASPLRAALVMALFWTGTLPVMVTLGTGLQRVAGPLRSRLPLVTASAVVVIGLLSITGRLRPPASPVMSSGSQGQVHVHGR